MNLRKSHFLAISISCILISCEKKAAEQRKDSGDEIEKIISSLTLEEKVGQMTNLTLATIATEENRRIKLDTAKIRYVIMLALSKT